MKPPHLRLVQEIAQPEPSATDPILDRATILNRMRQLIDGQTTVTLGFDRKGQPLASYFQGGLIDREEVEEMRLFLDLYLQVCPDERAIAHANGQRCAVPNCEHCLNQELEMRLQTYWNHVCVLKKSIQPGEVALVQVGDIYKVVASKDMSARLRGIERQSASTARCLHRIRTNDQNALKYLWLNAFAFFLSEGSEGFKLPPRAVEYFKAQEPIEIERDGNGDVGVPKRFHAQGFGVPLPEYPALLRRRWPESLEAST